MSNPTQVPVPLQVLKSFWVAIVVVLLVAGAAVHWFQNAFYDTGYAPEQPIAFYHKVHAGDLHIDCKYCHFNADRGKNAGAPPMSVCLGCHRNVSTDNPQYQKEINALLAVADKGSYQIDGATYHGQPDGVVYEGGVVHWKRIHQLPDHVYFSHQWHVRAGVACQTCHGPIETMTVVRQYSDLTMSWCLDCHRRSNYVGGRHYEAGDPSTFAVGSANRDVLRAQEVPDDVVTFVERQNAKPERAAAEDARAPEPTPTRILAGEGDREALVGTVVDERERAAAKDGATLPPELRKAMQAKLRGLPIWRLADLPETHRAFYQNESSFQNAPTQCNTCHQ